MANRIAKSDEALEKIIDELSKLQSTTLQLREAGETAGRAVQAAQQVAQLSDQIIKDSEAQLNATADLSTSTTERLDRAIAAQEALATDIRRCLQSELMARLAGYQRQATINQWLLIITLILVLANFGFVAWFIWLN